MKEVLWEVLAVPEIRVQAERLAHLLLEGEPEDRCERVHEADLQNLASEFGDPVRHCDAGYSSSVRREIHS